MDTKPSEILMYFRLSLMDEAWCPECLGRLDSDMKCSLCQFDGWEEYYGDDEFD